MPRRLPRIMCQTITIQTPTSSGTTPLGEPIKTWVSHDEPRCSLQPVLRTSIRGPMEEQSSAQESIEYDARLFLPPSAIIDYTCRVVDPFDSETVYEVIGQIQRWPDKTGALHHLECLLRLWEG